MLKLFNSLTKKKEEFVPFSQNKVGMYNCGPTVYDYVHIGNLRAFLVADILRRSLEYLGFEVKQVMNITDVGIGGDNDEGEDKIIKGLKREGKPITLSAMKDLTSFYTDAFLSDIQKLNIKKPHLLPKASEHIQEDIDLIKRLEEKGFVYKTSDGMYFDTSKDKNYAVLGGSSDAEHSRIGLKSEKKSPRDFALWKFNSSIGFPSPWGVGFPGWHIECSAMSMKYLGNTFDIHTGGIDLAPIHHNNEIAQSRNACDCEFARFWIHNAFVNMGQEKMAKSEGNVINLRTLEEKGFSPGAYRFWLLQARYNSPVIFSWEALKSAQVGLERLSRQIYKFENGSVDEKYIQDFKKFIEDDLDTPSTLALIQKLLKDDSVSDTDKKATILEFDKVLGLNLDLIEFSDNHVELNDVPTEIQELVSRREIARKDGNWAEADKLRQDIKAAGYEIEDLPEGPKISK